MSAVRSYALLFGLAWCISAPVYAVYKCESGGRVSYSDLPCESGKVIKVNTASTADSTTARRQAASEKDKLQKLERERHKREAADEREDRKASRQQAARQKKCSKIALRQKRAQEDVAKSSGMANEKAKRKAQHITEEYEAECGRWYERELSFAR